MSRNDRLISFIENATARGFEITGVTFNFINNPSQQEQIYVPPPQPVNYAPNPSVPRSGDYVVSFGKHDGKKLSDIGAHDLDNYVKFLVKKSGEDNKPLKGKVLEFVQTAEEYLKSIERPRR